MGNGFQSPNSSSHSSFFKVPVRPKNFVSEPRKSILLTPLRLCSSIFFGSCTEAMRAQKELVTDSSVCVGDIGERVSVLYSEGWTIIRREVYSARRTSKTVMYPVPAPPVGDPNASGLIMPSIGLKIVLDGENIPANSVR